MRAVERVLRRICPSKIIVGCEYAVPLLERFTLLRTPIGQLRVHHFLRSDEDRELHDHPWAFVTLILAGGYDEQIPIAAARERILDVTCGHENGARVRRTVLERRGPGSLLYRPARWAHRVEIAEGADAWTLIWMFPKSREWGFFRRAGWMPWRKYHSIAGCVDDSAVMS